MSRVRTGATAVLDALADDVYARRLIRLGLDLHDGPLQDLAALLGEVRMLRTQASDAFRDHSLGDCLSGRLDDIEARLVHLDGELRDLLTSSESLHFLDLPFEDTLEGELERLEDDTFRVSLTCEGDLEATTRSQRIALLRVVREAVNNAREHGHADGADVTIVADDTGVSARIADEGGGFDVEAALLTAAREGRLGIVGMAQRVSLLGGTFDIDSHPGGSTTISVVLPAWRESSPLDVAVEPAGEPVHI